MPNISYKGISLGDYGWISVETAAAPVVHEIPRAVGVIIQDMGAARKNITVRAWVVKDTYANLRSYFDTLADSFGTSAGTLVADGVSYTNCYFVSLTPEDRYEGAQADHFTVTFVQSQ